MPCPTLRHVAKPKLASKPRSSVNASQQSRIDAILKELRTSSHVLSPILSTFEDELRILERLYYKGRNQHRAALFWKKVQETRRFGQRLLEMQLVTLLDDLRYAFYDVSPGDGNKNRLLVTSNFAPSDNYEADDVSTSLVVSCVVRPC